ncbi:hypothetical protein [Aeromonas hydrophila]|uniref:hypothetical protein n=1 Tax=Aeromonas hydrophila TaxID=644 RepID=UPI0021E667D6|nr:hypothetical protein [Aeromonas hydrophila]MCV3278395.1 hypothetical protein [Aeromonas hydrophila]
MQIPLLVIDKNYESLSDTEVTAEVMDSYICMMSINMLDFPKRKEHILELVTHKIQYWERLIKEADELFWLNNEGRGWAVFYPSQDCGYTRIYRFKPSKEHDLRRNKPWDIGSWRSVQSEASLLDILNTVEYREIFKNWKTHQLKVNSVPTEFSEGRLSNTVVSKTILVTKGNGCAVCGASAGHHATTTLSEYSTVMLSMSLCEVHQLEASEHPYILKFFGTLFLLNIDIPDLIKLDHIPDNLIVPLTEIISSKLNAQIDPPEKRERGWHIRFKMQDGWSWLLRLNTLTDYAYMLFNPANRQVHRIDSADDHPNVQFGPDHQHFNPKTKRESIEPSFSYGIPLLDFPLLEKSKAYHTGL